MKTSNIALYSNKNITIRSFIYICCDVALFAYFCIDIQDYLFNSVLDKLLWAMCIFMMALRFIVDVALKSKKPLLSGHFFWYGGLILFGAISIFWTLNVANSVYLLKNMIKSFAILYFIVYSISTNKDIEKYLKMIIAISIFMVALLIVTTPLSAWGTDRIGYVTGINSNKISMLLSFAVLFCIYFFIKEKKKIYFIFIPLFVVISILTGSKKGLIILIFGILSILIFRADKRSKFFYLLIATLSILGVFYLMMNVGIFYKTLGVRMEGFISLLSGNGTVDGSTSERLYYIEEAKQLFLQKPFIGNGLNSFMSYMMIISYSHIAYSHNNYLELASCLGICGVTIYYSMYAYLLLMLKKFFSKDNLLLIVMLIILALFILLEVAVVDYYEVICQFLIALIFSYIKINKVKNS